MVDVMLVLLVIFMVAAPLMTVGVPVQLPKTAAQKVAQPKTPLIVSIDRDGRVFVGQDELTTETIAPRLAALAKESPDQVVLVRGDKAIDYGRVMTVMGEVGRAGFARVSLIAQAPDPRRRSLRRRRHDGARRVGRRSAAPAPRGCGRSRPRLPRGAGPACRASRLPRRTTSGRGPAPSRPSGDHHRPRAADGRGSDSRAGRDEPAGRRARRDPARRAAGGDRGGASGHARGAGRNPARGAGCRSPPPVDAAVSPPPPARPEAAPEPARPIAPAPAIEAVPEPAPTQEALPADAAPIPSTAVEAPALPLPLPAEPVPPTAVTALPPEPASARALPEPKPVPKPPPKAEPIPKERPRPTRQAALPGAAGASHREAASGASSRENTGGAAAAASDPNALARYAAQLAAALKARQRYPEAARAAGARGVATLRFSMNRSGRVLSAAIARSTGNPALDQAALATAAPGSMLPAAPADITQAVLTISVPLRFEAR